MSPDLTPLLHIAAALVAGGTIGFERTYHGRAAGFRTYALVCMSSAMAISVTVFPGYWPGGDGAAGPSDQTRVMQGILTGIGFLGAGVIVKEGLSVRGLTTAASIWTTAVVGVLIGARYYWEALAGVILILGTLSTFRWIEDRMPKDLFAQVTLRLASAPALERPELNELIAGAGLRIIQVSYGLNKSGGEREYELVVTSRREEELGALAAALSRHPAVMGYRISPTNE